MIQLTKLSAGHKTDGVPVPPAATITAAVHVELQPGAFLHVLLNQDGLMVRHGEIGVIIPLGEIVTLAINAETRLIAQPPPPGTEINALGTAANSLRNR